MATVLFWTSVVMLLGLAFWRPGYAAGYVLAAYVLEQCAQAFVPIAGQNDTLCNYLTAAAVLAGTVSKFLREGARMITLRAPTVIVLGLIAYCYATLLWSLFPSVTQQVLTTSLPYLVVFVALAPLLIGSRLDFHHAIVSFIICTGASFLLLLVFGEWGRRGLILPYWEAEAESNPLALAQGAGGLLIVVGLNPKTLGRSLWLRGLILSASLLIVLLVFLRSGSRGQIIAALATVAFFLSLGRGAKWLPVLAVAVVGIFASGVVDEEVSRNAARWETEKVEGAIVDERLGMSEHLLDFWASSSPVHLWIGLGHATSRDPRLLGGYPHNVPVEVLAEEGLVGALIYAVALLVAVASLVRAYGHSDRNDRPVVSTAAALLVYEFLLTLKQGSLLLSVAFLFLLVLPGALKWETST